MRESFLNVYDDEQRAGAYSELEFPGTYYLAFRDIPDLLERHVTGRSALDFGCGAGRSTRFLRDRGFEVVGVDISEAMLAQAVKRDPSGEYRLVSDGDLGAIGPHRFSLVFCAFTFDNVVEDTRDPLFRQLRDLLTDDGRVVIVASAPEIYTNEWTSFSTRDFPENRSAKTGDIVRIVMLDVPDRRPVEDVLRTDRDYLAGFDRAGLEILDIQRPLGRKGEPFTWISEESVSPWVIYVLARANEGDPGGVT